MTPQLSWPVLLCLVAGLACDGVMSPLSPDAGPATTDSGTAQGGGTAQSGGGTTQSGGGTTQSGGGTTQSGGGTTQSGGGTTQSGGGTTQSGGGTAQGGGSSLGMPRDGGVAMVPYSLPGVGQAVAIGVNTAAAVKPASFSAYNWAYSLFNCYGSGVMVPSYGTAGAYVVASSGGHNCPENTDAVIFDFSDARWKVRSNANGVPPSPVGFSTSQINFSYGELNLGTGQIPAPSHLYQAVAWLPPRLGGGPQGSYLKLTTRFAGPSPDSAMGLHVMRLDTGLWQRATDDVFSADKYDYYSAPVAVFDDTPGAERYFLLEAGQHKHSALRYFDPADGHIKSTVSFARPADYTCYPGCGNPTYLFDPVRRLIISQGGANSGTSRSAWPLRAIELDNLAAGWHVLQSTGPQPGDHHDAPRWAFYPTTGRFYTHDYDDGQQLWRLSPPSGNWKTGTWTFDRVTLGGALLPNYASSGQTGGPSDSSRGTFMYVPDLDCLAWISGDTTPVMLLKPPY